MIMIVILFVIVIVIVALALALYHYRSWSSWVTRLTTWIRIPCTRYSPRWVTALFDV